MGDGMWPWAWLVVAVALVALDLTVLGRSLVALPVGVAALLAAAFGFAGVAPDVQVGVALGGGLLLLAVTQRYRALVREGSRLPTGVGATRLVGARGEVVTALAPEGGGVVRVGGETWHAVADDGRPVPTGTAVRVLAVEGVHLLVTAAPDR